MASYPAPVTPYAYGTFQDIDQSARSSYLNRIKRAAILQIFGGCFLFIFGILAIILKAHFSYYATAVWSGILIFGVTGVIGKSASSNGNRCLIRTYFIMSIFGCIMGFVLFYMHIAVAGSEVQYDDDECQPGSYVVQHCWESMAARQACDSLICITGFFLFVLCIVSLSIGCCCPYRGSPNCCDGGGCCHCCEPPPLITVSFPPHAQGVAGAKPGHYQYGQQAERYVVRQGPPSFMQPSNVAMPPPTPTNQGQGYYAVAPQASRPSAPPYPISDQMQPQEPNRGDPPAYSAPGQSHAQHFPPVDQPNRDVGTKE